MPNKALVTIIFGVLLLAGGAYLAGLFVGDSKGYTRALAEGNARAVELQKMLSRASHELTQAENKIAEQVSRANQAEKERIRAIKTNDHQSERIVALQRELDRLAAVDRAEGDNHLIVVDANAIERVWDEAVRGGGQPHFEPAGAVQARLPAIALITGAGWGCKDVEWRQLICSDKDRDRCLQRVPRVTQHIMAGM